MRVCFSDVLISRYIIKNVMETLFSICVFIVLYYWPFSERMNRTKHNLFAVRLERHWIWRRCSLQVNWPLLFGRWRRLNVFASNQREKCNNSWQQSTLKCKLIQNFAPPSSSNWRLVGSRFNKNYSCCASCHSAETPEKKSLKEKVFIFAKTVVEAHVITASVTLILRLDAGGFSDLMSVHLWLSTTPQYLQPHHHLPLEAQGPASQTDPLSASQVSAWRREGKARERSPTTTTTSSTTGTNLLLLSHQHNRSCGCGCRCCETPSSAALFTAEQSQERVVSPWNITSDALQFSLAKSSPLKSVTLDWE